MTGDVLDALWDVWERISAKIDELDGLADGDDAVAKGLWLARVIVSEQMRLFEDEDDEDEE